MEHYRASIKDYEIFDLGDFRFQSGQVLPNSKLAYKTYGELNSKRDNAILIPVPVNGSHESTADIHMKGDGRAISPKKHFVVIPNMFGNTNLSLGCYVSGYGREFRTNLWNR